MASFTPSKVLIFGGTGVIGRYITSALLHAKPSLQQLVLFTSPSSAKDKAPLLEKWKSEGLSVIAGDLTSEADVTAAYRDTGADTVISAVGRGGLQHQINLLRLAEASSSVQWFLPSEFGTDIEHNTDKSPHERPHQLKLQVRRYIRENLKRLKVTYVVTGPYFDMWVDAAPGFEKAGGFLAEKKQAYVIGDGNGKVGFCTMRDVGKFVVATLRSPEAAFGKALKVQSFVVTPNEVLAEYERQTGSKWEVTQTPFDEVRAFEAKVWEDGDPRAPLVTLRRIWAEGGPGDRASGIDALDEAILRYNLVIEKGREMSVAVVKEKTDASKQRAEAIKANVAVKDMFESALGMYGEGSSQLAAKEYETAAESYGKSGSAFDEAYAAAAEKRAKAQEAMRAAEEATAESQRKAEEADPLIEPIEP